MPDDKPAVLIVGHGSPQEEGNLDFKALALVYQKYRPELSVHHAYIEFAEPDVSSALNQFGQSGLSKVIVLPFILFAAGHVKHDIPNSIACAVELYPQLAIRMAREIGVDDLMVKILWDRATQVGLRQGQRRALRKDEDPRRLDPLKKTVIVVVGRGSSDPAANSDFCKLVRLFAEQTSFTWVIPCFIGVTTPSLDEALELACQIQPENLFVLPYYLFRGVLITRIEDKCRQFAQANPQMSVRLSKPVGVDRHLFGLIDERIKSSYDHESNFPLKKIGLDLGKQSVST